jgi:flagellar basal body-associated protein FliL
MENEKAPKKSKLKLILLIIIPIILIISIGLGYMVFTDTSVSDIQKLFEKEEEQTLLLEEFLVNIKSPAGKNRYLKIKLALMYNDANHGEILNANVNKIRDIIIADLRERHSEEILDIDKTEEIKTKITEDINSVLNSEEKIVKDVYITDLIVQ